MANKQYSSIVDALLDDRKPDWEALDLESAVDSGEQQLDRTHKYVDESFEDAIGESAASHHTLVWGPRSASAPARDKQDRDVRLTAARQLAQEKEANKRARESQVGNESGSRTAGRADDFISEIANDVSVMNDKTYKINKAPAVADLSQKAVTDRKVYQYINTLLTQGHAPAKVAAILVNLAAGLPVAQKSKVGANANKELFENFANSYRGAKFTWEDGREKGMSFYLQGLDDAYSSDPHFRGSYENHPSFGNIPDDMHQATALFDDVNNGTVNVTKDGIDVTARCRRDAENVLEELEGGYDEGSAYADDDPEAAWGSLESSEKTASDAQCMNCGAGVSKGSKLAAGPKAADQKYKCPDCETPVGETLIGQGSQVPMGHCPKCKGGAKKLVSVSSEKTASEKEAEGAPMFNKQISQGYLNQMSGVLGFNNLEQNHFMPKTPESYQRLASKVADWAGELTSSINRMTAGVPKAQKQAAIARIAQREQETKQAAKNSTKTAAQRTDQGISLVDGEHFHQSSPTAVRGTQKKQATFSFTASTVDSLFKKGHSIEKIYTAAARKVGSVDAGNAVKAFIASLKKTGGKVALSQIDCTFLKQKLGVQNAIVGASKCSSCVFRQGMHCGLTGGTLLSFPGMDKMASNHKIAEGAPKDGRSMLAEFDLTGGYPSSAGDIDIKESSQLDVQLGSSFSLGDVE